jgi:hypothetical protein
MDILEPFKEINKKEFEMAYENYKKIDKKIEMVKIKKD